MPDQPVTEESPQVLRDQFHELLFDLLRVFFAGEPESLGKSGDVSIDHNANVHIERIAENDISRFAPDAPKLNQFVHRTWHFTFMTLDDSGSRSSNAFGFVSKKSCGLDDLFKF